MKTILALIILLTAHLAHGGWLEENCATAITGSPNAGRGDTVCYEFSSTDLESSVRSFRTCDNVDWVFDENSDTCVLFIYTCVTTAKTTCQKYSAAGLSGAAGANTYSGVPGVLQYLKCEGGAVANNPKASGTCH